MTESQTDPDLLYIGTYTAGTKSEGVYLVRMDRRSGELRHIGAVSAGANPSFLAVHPNRRVLYAVNELDQGGAVSAFAIQKGIDALTRLNEQPSEGGAPCYVSVDKSGRAVLVANYAGGNVALLPIEANGALAPAHAVQHTGKGPNAERQEAPHAHCIVPDPTNRFALAADLGADRVFVYGLDLDGKTLRPAGEAVMRAGAGPRHLAFHPTLPLVFVANELDSTVATLRFDSTRGALTVLGARSTLPAGWTGGGTNYPADIHVAASGRTVYVSNRGHNSIAVFSMAGEGALTLDQVVSTEGDWPRNFSLDPSGQWLLVANQRSNSVIVFARDPDTGRLTLTKQRIAIPSPVCLRFA